MRNCEVIDLGIYGEGKITFHNLTPLLTTSLNKLVADSWEAYQIEKFGDELHLKANNNILDQHDCKQIRLWIMDSISASGA